MNQAIFTTDNTVIVTFLASFLIWFMLGGLVFLWLIDGKVKREQALHAFLSATLAWVFSNMVKSLFPSERPFGFFKMIPLTLTTPSLYSSFPSAHAAVAFAVAVSIWIHNKKLGTRFLLLALLVSVGRILSGVHYFHDVVAGALIGILTSYLVKRLHVFKLVE